MTEGKKESNSCKSRKNAMLAYGIIQLGSNVISAIALIIIGLGFCSLVKEAKLSNNCVEEIIESGSEIPDAVRFCNGG